MQSARKECRGKQREAGGRSGDVCARLIRPDDGAVGMSVRVSGRCVVDSSRLWTRDGECVGVWMAWVWVRRSANEVMWQRSGVR